MNSINLQRSQMMAASQQLAASGQGALEVQDFPLYSYVTLPTPLTGAGVQFFGDTIASVGIQRTNMTRPNQPIPGTNYEVHGIRVIFAAPLTVVFSSFNTAILGAAISIFVNNTLRFQRHLRSFLPASIYAPSFSAAAGDNPVVTDQGYDGVYPLALAIPIQGETNFSVTITFATDVAALNATVMGVEFQGLLDRGNIKVDQTPVRVM
jgi:hypothetical protein